MNRRTFLAQSLGLATALTMGPPSLVLSTNGLSGNYDIAIIGAGLFGSAAARHLSQTADGIALIGPAEPTNYQEHSGVFASHYDASRLTRIVDPDLIWGTLAKRSVQRYREIEERSSISFYREIGYMMVTPGGLGTDWFNFPAMREVASDLEVELEELDDAALEDQYPFLSFTPGSGAMRQSQNAGYFNPRHLVAAQQQIAVDQGVTLIRAEVVGLKTIEGMVEISTRSGETVRANRVLVATGASTNASNLLPYKLDTQVRAAMIMVAEVPQERAYTYPTILYAKTDGREPFWGLLMPPIRYPDGRYYLKTMDGYYGPKPLESYEELGAWSRSRGHEDHHAVLQQALRDVFPSLTVTSTQFKPCLITDTASHYPYIDMLDDRIGIAVGGNGKSAKSSDEIGRLAAEMVLADRWSSSIPQAVFRSQFVNP